jgi:hypothetical protein
MDGDEIDGAGRGKSAKSPIRTDVRSRPQSSQIISIGSQVMGLSRRHRRHPRRARYAGQYRSLCIRD